MSFTLARRAAPIALLVALAAAALPGVTIAAPSIGISGTNTGDYPGGLIPRYEKFEVTFTISGVGTAFTDYNPFNPNISALGSQYYNKRGILVDGLLTAPDGRKITWPAFWFDSGVWKFRFAPDQLGKWQYQIRAQDNSGTGHSSIGSFTVTEKRPDGTVNRGFIRRNPRDWRLFEYSDGTPYFPIGTCLSGYTGGSAVDAAKETFPQMQANKANFTRIFFTSTNIEPYCVGSDKSTPKALNNYNIGRARSLDQIFELAQKHGVFIEYVIDDWTYLKDQSNQYIRASGREAPCADVNEFFTSSAAKEIYNRKIRYFSARWGYATSFMAYDLINELGGGGTGTKPWHTEIWATIRSYSAQPHFATSSNGSGELRTGGGIPWDSSECDFTNYHDYAKYTQGWTIKIDGSTNLEKLGSSLEYPWVDVAVWVDRIVRLQYKRYNWKKPMLWTEYGLIYRKPGSTGFPDWDAAYKADTGARHVKDASWAAALAASNVAHWKLNYMLGKYGGGSKFWVFKPIGDFLEGESFEGLTQETTYSVSDPLNSNPGVTSSNGNVMVMAQRGPTRAYLYVKNLTDVWARVVDSSICPSPSSQSATIRVRGMQAGTYELQRWSTTETDSAKQILSRQNITVGSDGIATISVSGLGVDTAFKIKSGSGVQPPPPVVENPDVKLTMSSDVNTAVPGSQITYTIAYTNSGPGEAKSVVITAPVPTNTTYVGGSASAGGMHDSASNKVNWTVASITAGAGGTVTFKVKVN